MTTDTRRNNDVDDNHMNSNSNSIHDISFLHRASYGTATNKVQEQHH